MKKILTAVLLFSLAACGQAETTSSKKESAKQAVPVKRIDGWQMLDHSDYEIQYPKDWELNQSREMGTSFFLFAPLDSPEDTFRENVNLLIQDLTGRNIDLDEYTRISIDQINKMMPNSAIIESKRAKSTSGDYQKISYTGDQANHHLKFEQYYWIIDGKAWVLTLTCEADQFEAYKETGEKILDSFVLKN